MAGLKSLAKDTAIYGLSSIVGRFLNYMLVPLYTAVLPASTGGYGVVSNVYVFSTFIFPSVIVPVLSKHKTSTCDNVSNEYKS